MSALRADPVTAWTWDAVRTAAAGTAGWKRTRRGEWRGPCKCGGERDRAWIRRGRAGVVAGCNAGCSGVAVLRWLAGDVSARLAPAFPPRRDDRPRPRPPSRPAHPKPVGGDSGRFQAATGPNRPKPAPSTKNDRVGPPVSDDLDSTRPPVPPDSGPVAKARRLWARSQPVPLDASHPARRWAAARPLWPPGELWPEAVRWLPHPDGGSLVAAFAPVQDWRTAHPPVPTGVQLVHLDGEGRPRKDRGGLGKRSRGTMTGAVCVTGGPLDAAPAVHVAEGLADALAVAAREDGPALASAGTAALSRLAPALAALAVPVLVWPDGDPPGRNAAGRLVADLRRLGAVAALAAVPDGLDPAALAGPFTPRIEKVFAR